MKLFVYKILTVLILLNLCSCRSHKDLSTLDSDDYKNKEDRIEELKKQIVDLSEIYDAEFELFNVNGFVDSRDILVPGASSWRYEFVVKIDTSDIGKWLEDFSEIKNAKFDLKWTNKITEKRKENWKTFSKPKFYNRPNEGVCIILYEKEGILFKSIVNL